ncbi:MAG TPA: TetR/AcrR family transcriptional regulator [Petrotogaceae bacterium]|nr:TetR/AcrR family transcriptional regulator [Petrotogaceae bacterium]
MPKTIEDVENLILKNAFELLKTYGYHKLNMREIAKKSSIATGTIYNYFPTKDELMISLIRFYWKDYREKMYELFSSEEDVLTKMRRIFLMIDTFIRTFEGFIPEYAKSGREKPQGRVNEFIDEFRKGIKMALDGDKSRNPVSQIKTEELSVFIAANMISIALYRLYSYDSFENILKILILK